MIRLDAGRDRLSSQEALGTRFDTLRNGGVFPEASSILYQSFIETLRDAGVIRFSSETRMRVFPIPTLFPKRIIVGSTRIVHIDEGPLIERLTSLFERPENEDPSRPRNGERVCEAHILAPNLILLDLSGAWADPHVATRQLRDGTGGNDTPILKLASMKQRLAKRPAEAPAARVERESSDQDSLGEEVPSETDPSTGLLTQEPLEPVLRVGPVRIDRHGHWAYLNEKKLHLTPTEFRLLECFLREPGRAFTRSQLLDVSIGNSSFVLERTIDVHIRSLRAKLGSARELVETVRGVGYRFRENADVRLTV
jgi:two-component system phosphate regulon response regulator PhoB